MLDTQKNTQKNIQYFGSTQENTTLLIVDTELRAVDMDLKLFQLIWPLNRLTL